MRASDLGLSKESIRCLEEYGVQTLYEAQAAAVEAGLLEGQNILVSAPTAGGKSLVAIMAVLAMLEGGGRRAVYLSPLRALAAEKHAEFTVMGRSLGGMVRSSASTVDLNSRDRLIGNVLCITNERMDLALRKNESWLEEIDLVIADEIHMVGDPHRGPTLEMVLSMLKDNKRQIVGLSATISNAQDIAQWLDCKLVSSTWRPVRLAEGICDGINVKMNDGTSYDIDRSSRGAAVDLALDSVRNGGQALIFTNTRKGAPSQAGKAAAAVARMLDRGQLRHLKTASCEILRYGENTGLAENLAELVLKGVAFHHAGLNERCRHIVEDQFRDGHIKIMAATPTLSSGVNLPARRVIISQLSRYDARYGRNMPISVMEYKQLCGRAGRPQYDDIGEAIAVAEQNPYVAMDRYVHGEPEDIQSMLHARLGSHALSMVVSEPGITAESLQRFFDSTLGGLQYGGMDLEDAMQDLEDLGMIESYGKRYAATRLGEITDRLYLEPVTAVQFLETVEKSGENPNTLVFLDRILACAEFYPVLPLKSDQHQMAQELVEREDAHGEMYVHPDQISRSMLGLFGWINEESEKDIASQYGVESGDIHRSVESARWLLQSMSAIAAYARMSDVQSALDTLRTRMIYGVKPDIVPLMALRNVGRIRGRALYDAGAHTLQDVSTMSIDKIRLICKVGVRVAQGIQSGV